MTALRGIARKTLRQLRRVVGAPGPWFVHDAGYRMSLPGVSVDPLRAHRILAFLLDEGLATPADVSAPIPVSLQRLGQLHTQRYLESLDRPESFESVVGFTVSDEERQKIIDDQRLVVGGTIHATRLALKTGRVAINLGGGYHHAWPDHGQAYCVFNDVAVSIARLRRKRFHERVLVIDLDLHDGNGTRAAFAEDPSVFTFSIHNRDWDPVEAVADLSVALGSEVTDERYLVALKSELPGLLASHRPGLVFYIAGTDPAADDTLGDWRISPEAMLERDRYVIQQLGGPRSETPRVVLLGGGYGDRAWHHSARFFAWLTSGESRDPDTALDAVVRMFRRIDRESPRPTEEGDGEWTLEEDDIGLPGLAASTESRFLGVLSKHAVELSLERFGILNKIRSRGFRHPSVQLEATPPLGHTLRVFGDAGGDELLMEQRVSRNRSAIPGMELFYAEWLLLQNPRTAFDASRAPLPGQRHPGLGLMREIVAWWLVLCERLKLDGILFVPSHYYMATLGRRHLRFLQPEDEAAYDAFRTALSGMRLSEASRAVDAGRVVEQDSGQAVRWHVPMMVLPVGRELREKTAGPSYQAALEQARARLQYRIA